MKIDKIISLLLLYDGRSNGLHGTEIKELEDISLLSGGELTAKGELYCLHIIAVPIPNLPL